MEKYYEEKKLCEDFFLSNPPPSDLADVAGKTRDFIKRHNIGNKPVVLITSGGTTAPLERNTVRFLDNFSGGIRGSSSAEYFLSNGYAVIFLHRKNSKMPFQRHLKNDDFLDWFTVSEVSEDGGGRIKFCCEEEVESKLSKVIADYQKSKKEGTLLCLPFITIFQYLFYLKEISILLGVMGSRAMVYLAAAVADFYVSYASMAQHKIHSSGPLDVNFNHTPKMVHLLTKKWAPEAFVVTFKLETDSQILIDHAKGALLKYNHQVVVANLLDSFRTTVTVVTRSTATPSADVDQDTWETLKLQLSGEDISRNVELEVFIIPDLVVRHQAYMTLRA